MSRKLLVQTKHKFTSVGYWGVSLFIASPIVGGISYSVILSEAAKRYSSGPGPAPLFLGLAGIAFCAAIPLMLIGRASLHLAETHENDEQAFKVWKEWDRPPSANSE